MPHATPFRGINLITQKRSRSIDHSNGEFFNFLSGQLSSWNLPPLTCYLLQPSPSLDYIPHNPCHTLLWAQSNNDNNKIIAGIIAPSVVSITIFYWSTVYLEMALPDLISSSTSPSTWITNILPHAAPSNGFNLATKIWSMTNGY